MKKVVDKSVHPTSMHESVSSLQKELAYYLRDGRRDLPWRQLSHNSGQRFYEVLVSEMMLQQTQVQRVVPKYEKWLSMFPDMPTLARATLHEVLAEWKGLGYSRRAKYLLDICKVITVDDIPSTLPDLVRFNGIGINTAGAILAYSSNMPEIFIETNIRTVLFHHFFEDRADISDAELRDVMSVVIDYDHPREWYWAMMDYGAYLKKHIKNIQKSKHYTKQLRFEGSARQKRSGLLDALVASSLKKDDALRLVMGYEYILDDLQREGMIVVERGTIRISS